MGRKKLSSDIKKQRGTYQPCRDLEVNPAGFLTDIPEPPKGAMFGAVGAAMWYRVCHFLVEKQRLTAVGLPQIERYCDWAEVYHAAIKEHKEMPVLEFSNGNRGENPYLKAATRAAAEMRREEKSWGLSPVSDIALPQTDPVGEYDEFTIR